MFGYGNDRADDDNFVSYIFYSSCCYPSYFVYLCCIKRSVR